MINGLIITPPTDIVHLILQQIIQLTQYHQHLFVLHHRLDIILDEILENDAVRERLLGIGLNVPSHERRTPAYLAKLVVSELDKWAVPVKASGAAEE